MQQTRRRLMTSTGIAVAGIALGRSVSAESTPAPRPGNDATRLIQHAMGETAAPTNPVRVIALDGPILDACLLLGVTPVGATTGVADAPWPEYLGEATAGIVNVGEIVEPDLERIAALKPDLIIGVKSRNEKIYGQLSGIAPTVFSETHRDGWRESFHIYADALNQSDQVTRVEQDFELRCEQITAELGDERKTMTVSVLRTYQDVLYAYQVGSFSGSVLESVGLARPESQSDPDQMAVELSPEQVILADADVLFLTTWAEEGDETAFTGLVSNSLWESLDVVKAGRVYFVPDEYWMVGIGYIAANRILDDLATYLIDGAEPRPLPSA